MMKSVDFETRDRTRDGSSPSPGSLRIEMITSYRHGDGIKMSNEIGLENMMSL